ncbi:uncharacterized protein LOC123010152 [Tribolium madens]|uniref:uncharacterized protein LOC123010152 n=1 Tax=Tribolium madens TaxID=41895 RepID=UPI001CF74B7A|nr:uncharacterized protein LOC123010152 [Tribolium madens]
MPQGGVLSPLLWDVVVDSLLRRLNEAGFYTIGYADDLVILLTGRHEEVLCSLMQTALSVVEKWCTEHALSAHLCYGVVVWWPRVRQKNETKRIGHLQRLICLAITGAMRSTPTAAIEVALCIPPLDMFVEEAALEAAIRLRAAGQWNMKGRAARHTRILTEASERMPLLNLGTDRAPAKYVFEKPYSIMLTSEEQSTKPDICIYTDGSKNNTGSGSGIYSEDLLAELAKENVDELAWVKGHDGNPGNEEADKLARFGSERPTSGPTPNVALATTTFRAMIKQDTLCKHTARCKKTEGCMQSKAAMAKPCMKRAKYCLDLSRDKLRRLIGIWTGHCRLNQHLQKMGAVDDPTCRGCLEDDESARHVLCYCPALASTRGSMLGDFWSSMASIGSTPPGKILKFIDTVGWLEE